MKILEPRDVINKVKKFIGKNGTIAIITVMIVGLIVHAYLYTHNVMSSDGLAIGSYHLSDPWEKSLGRWGIQFFDFARGGIVNEVLIVAVSLVILSMATVFLLKLFDIKSTAVTIGISLLMATAPQFASTFLYIFCADAYCFAMLSSVLAVYFMRRKKGKRILNYIISIALIIFTLSIYQAYIGVVVGLSMLTLLMDLLQNKDSKEVLKEGIKQIVVMIISLILYFIATKLILKLIGLEIASYSGANNVSITNFKISSIFQTYKSFYNYYFTDSILHNIYWKRSLINLCILAISVGNLIMIIANNKVYKNKLSIIGIILIIILLPLGLNVIEIIANEKQINLLMAASLILVYIAFLKQYELLKQTNLEIISKYIILGLVCILTTTYAWSNNATYMVREYIYNNYYSTSVSIVTKVESLEGYNKDMYWMFNDLIRYTPSLVTKSNGFGGYDYETWNEIRGIYMTNNFYFRYLGKTIKMCPKYKYDEIVKTEEYKNMPLYPNDGSIRIIDNVVVIKLSDKIF